MTESIKLTRREVIKGDAGFQVVERHINSWRAASKVYAHSTSAFAALGRLTQKETKKIDG